MLRKTKRGVYKLISAAMLKTALQWRFVVIPHRRMKVMKAYSIIYVTIFTMLLNSMGMRIIIRPMLIYN